MISGAPRFSTDLPPDEKRCQEPFLPLGKRKVLDPETVPDTFLDLAITVIRMASMSIQSTALSIAAHFRIRLGSSGLSATVIDRRDGGAGNRAKPPD